MQDSYVNVDGVRVRYRDSGATSSTAPVVLLMHGIGGSLELWSSQFVPPLAGLRLIALDLPGHGYSDFGDQPYFIKKFASFVWRFADALDLERVHLAGNSMGAAIGLQMLALQPLRTRSLLLAAAATLGREAPTPFRLMTLPLLGPLMTRPGTMAIQQQLAAIFHPDYAIPADIRSTIERNVMRPGAQAAFLATLRELTDLGGQRATLVADAHAALRAASVPMLLLHGRQDRVIPVAHSENAHRLAPQTRLQILEGCGHTPQLEQAAAFNLALEKLVLTA